MERWQNKLAVVTGASSGIGAACSRAMIAAGLRVVALARREKKLKELSESLPSNLKQNLIARRCDVSKEEQPLQKLIDKSFNYTRIRCGSQAFVRGLSIPIFFQRRYIFTLKIWRGYSHRTLRMRYFMRFVHRLMYRYTRSQLSQWVRYFR
ncbi:farnesol dehydrogenase isoform X2 [Drosophila nasuta]|uniref:Farnesol dehydrogenase isoform X2 n=1 Tax=Drosophila albomicans TaxID=7291 RepID=A0A6P8W6F6_DROAB|nr:farnesol dehydrogenase isoform X2 [Drosophila albomicans]XP_060665269.1 farnesol dehydrogenase isoform X2 [Drosophila nasuta]